MKKLIYCAAALAAMIFAGSCQQENLEPVAQENTVTYTVELPDVQTKAIGDANNVDDLIYEVWVTKDAKERDLNGSLNDVPKATRLYQKTTKILNGRTVITLNLVQDQNYTVLFWAQDSDGKIYLTEDLTNVRYAKGLNGGEDGYKSNDEYHAAFYGIDFFYNDNRHIQRKTVTLTRPFAQLNIASRNTQMEESEDEFGHNEYGVEVLESKVTVEGVGTSFNVAQNPTDTERVNGVGNSATVIFDYNTDPSDENEYLFINGKPSIYEHVAMNYLFAAGNNVKVHYEILVKVTGKDKDEKGTETEVVVKNTIDQVPLQENYRTNIMGNLLTSTAEYTVIIDKDFVNPDFVMGDEWSQSGDYNYTVNAGASAGALKEVLEHADAAARAAATKAAGPEVKITLNDDVEWETGAGIGSTPLLREDSPISAVVINGNGKTFTATGNGVGQIRLANGALLTFNNVKVVDHSVSYAENSWEYGYLEFGGKLAFNDCQFVNAIMMESENAAFTNCSFNSNHDNEYAVWVSKGIATFNGCTFTGARGLKVHEAYGSEVASVEVDGCTFSQLTKKPGIALGNLNAQTSVTIQNSTFDRCQAGDQDNYMYETDTDVTTFNFVRENNVVIPSGDGVVEQENGTLIVSSAAGLKAAIEAAQDGDTIYLMDGVYDSLFHVGGKSITLKALNDKKAEIAGRISVAGDANSTFTCEDLKLAVSDNTNNTFNNTYYDKGIGYIIGVYCGNVVVKNCEFNGMTDDYGAITFHSYASGATTETLEKLIVENSKFNGGRAIRARSNVSVTNCEFSGLVNPCLQVLGLGADGIDSEVVFTGNESDVAVSGVCIKTSNYSTKNITFNVSGNTNCNTISFDEKNVNNLYPDTYKYTGEVNGLTPEGGKGLAKMLSNDKINVINLAAGAEYDLTEIQHINHPVTLNGDVANKPIIKGKLVAEGAFAANNVKFMANDATSLVYTGAGTYEKNNYAGIVHLRYVEGTFEGCEFDRNGCGINYFNDASGKLLKVNNCTFTNGCFIYSKALCEVTKSSFDASVPLYIWPRDTNGHPEWVSQCTFTGNTVSYNNGYAVGLLSQSCPYRNIVFNVQNYTGTFRNIYAAVNSVMNNPAYGVANDGTVTFADGSKKFKINDNGTFGGDINE